MKIKVVLTGNMDQRLYYVRYVLDHNKDKNYKFSRPYFELTNDKERILFVTPGQDDKIRGIRISSFEEYGTPEEHPGYKEFMEVLKRQLY